MKKRVLSLLLCIYLVSILFTGCGNKNTTDEVSESADSVVEETQEESVVETVKSKRDLIAEKEFASTYFDLHGYWVNDTVSYYFGSFLKGEEVVLFYTRTDEPDNWYSFELISDEINSDGYSEQYLSHKIAANITDNNGNAREIELYLLYDCYSNKYHLDIVDGEEVINLTCISSDISTSMMEWYNYFKFIDLRTDESGNVTMSLVDIKDISSWANGTIDEKSAFYFYVESLDKYYLFIKDNKNDVNVYIYDGCYSKDELKGEYGETCGLTIYPWVYEMFYNPFFELGAEAFEPIPLSEEILGGYVYKVLEDKSVTYHGIEGMYLDSYYRDIKDFEFTKFDFKPIEGDYHVSVRITDGSLYDSVYTGERLDFQNPTELTYINTSTKVDNYIIGYDTENPNEITIMQKKFDLTFTVGIEMEVSSDDYSAAVSEAQKYFDAFSAPNGEKSMDVHLRETFPFAGYYFTDRTHFYHIQRDKDSSCGLKFIRSDYFCYFLNELYNSENDDVTVHRETIYDTGYEKSFEVYANRNVTTHNYGELIAKVPNERNKYLYFNTSLSESFFEYGKEFSEIEEESLNYLLRRLNSSLTTEAPKDERIVVETSESTENTESTVETTTETQEVNENRIATNAAELEELYQDAKNSWSKKATWTASNGVTIKINDAWADIVTSGEYGGGSEEALYYDGTQDLTPTSPYRLAIYEFLYDDEAYLNGKDRYNPTIVDVSTLPVIQSASTKQTSVPKSEEFYAYKEAFDIMYGFQTTGKWEKSVINQLQNYETGIGLTRMDNGGSYCWNMDYNSSESEWVLCIRVNPSQLQWNSIENALKLVSPDGAALYNEFYRQAYEDNPTFPEVDMWVNVGNSQAKVQFSDYYYCYFK